MSVECEAPDEKTCGKDGEDNRMDSVKRADNAHKKSLTRSEGEEEIIVVWNLSHKLGAAEHHAHQCNLDDEYENHEWQAPFSDKCFAGWVEDKWCGNAGCHEELS